MVRAAATQNISQLTQVLGNDWAETHVLPQIDPTLISHSNYLLRVTAIQVLAKLAALFPGARVEGTLIPLLLGRVTDEVPNVR